MHEIKLHAGWLARRREKRRLDRERAGDTPERLAERRHRRRREPDVKDAMARTGEMGFLTGGSRP
jgi:hypothetical protein